MNWADCSSSRECKSSAEINKFREENELAHEGTEMQFSAIKISHYPFRSVPLPEVYVNTQQDPISKLKTSTSQALPMSENKESPHLRRSPWAMDSHMIKAATKCWNRTTQNWIRRQNKDFAKNRLLIIIW